METTNINMTRSDRFSWHRVAEFATYFRPICTRQILVYLSVSAVCAILTLLPTGRFTQAGLFTIIWAVIPLLFNFAPIMLAKSGDYRMVERMIPVKASEKLTFYLIYFYIAIALAVYALPLFANWLYLRIPAVQTDTTLSVIQVQLGNPPVLLTINILSALCTATTCLYVVMSARTGRVSKGVIAALATQFAIGILGVFLGGATAFSRGYMDAANHVAEDKMMELGDKANFEDGFTAGLEQGMDASYDIIADMMQHSALMYVGIVIEAAYLILMLCLTYRYLKKSNI